MPDVKVTLKSYLASLQKTHSDVPTQAELAALIGLSRNNFNRIVNNKNKYGFTRSHLATIIIELKKIDPECDIDKLLKFIP